MVFSPALAARRRDRCTRPPAPSVPERSFDPKLPITVTGKSVWIPPFVVAARTLNSADAGNEACTLPLVVATSISPVHLAFPIVTLTLPFVVRAEAHSLVATSTLPLVVVASTTLFSSRQRIPPFVVIAFSSTPLGTFTLKFSLV